ncbi:MAG: RidA family protein [Desulfobacterales bacterium]|jgi:2-iminobutanoate/2-iminopropanoate deaminase
MISFVQPKCIPASDASSGYSQIVMDDAYAYLAGIVAADFPAGQKVLGDVAAETRALLNVIRNMLAEISVGVDRIVRVDVHLADFEEFDKMDSVYREFFEKGRYPARTTTESQRLYGGSRVEITCTARLS